MKLIRICNKDGAYVVDALEEYKLLGIKIFSSKKSFVQNAKEKKWYESGSKDPVKNWRKVKLDHWLNKHKRFVP